MNWKLRPEGGGRVAIRLFRGIAISGGRGIARVLLVPITLYFVLRRAPERRASRAYLGRVLGRPASLWDVARHVHCFAATILDRAFMLTDRFDRFEVEVHGLDGLHAAMADGRSVLLLGSHHGSFEALRALSMTRPGTDVRIVFDRRQNPAMTQLLEELNPAIARGVIDAGQSGTAIVLALQQAAAEGALIGLLADRARPGDPVVRCDFLGAAAPFPTSPFLIAATLRVPVVLCFGLYLGGRRYALHFEPFADPLTIPRAARQRALAEAAQRYATRLEHYVRLAPLNWFNFYDFWQGHVDEPAAAGTAAPGVADRG